MHNGQIHTSLNDVNSNVLAPGESSYGLLSDGSWGPTQTGNQLGNVGSGPMSGFQTGQLALGGVGALANLWASMQGIKLGKRQLAENTRQFGLNYGAQKKTTNAALEDRQRARVASGSGYQSVSDYMAQNAIV